jgi:hypothetical protein
VSAAPQRRECAREREGPAAASLGGGTGIPGARCCDLETPRALPWAARCQQSGGCVRNSRVGVRVPAAASGVHRLQLHAEACAEARSMRACVSARPQTPPRGVCMLTLCPCTAQSVCLTVIPACMHSPAALPCAARRCVALRARAGLPSRRRRLRDQCVACVQHCYVYHTCMLPPCCVVLPHCLPSL